MSEDSFSHYETDEEAFSAVSLVENARTPEEEHPLPAHESTGIELDFLELEASKRLFDSFSSDETCNKNHLKFNFIL